MKIRHIPSIHQRRKKRVAAYCRVSTDMKSQEESFETQVRYYQSYIERNGEWVLAGIYADGGVSATGAAKRPEFMRMIADAMEGKIDLILVKSISRFSRNVVDCQVYVQQLRSKGVEVRFEKERLSSLDASSEMIFSMMAAIAQDESRSISQNIRWGYEKRFAQGIHHMGSNQVLGYDEVDGVLTPNGDAWIVKMAFELFNQGTPYQRIAEAITAAGGKRLRGATPFDGGTIRYMIQNEIYVGDRRMQKQPPQNYLTKEPDPNARYQSYYWRDTHEGIIDRKTWEKAQEVVEARRKDLQMGVDRKGKETHFLYGKVFCASCGAPYKRRTLPHKRVEGETVYHKVWNCRERQKGPKGNGCRNNFIREEELLRKVSDQLGWEWKGADDFDAEQFNALVQAVYVENGEVSVRRLARRVSA